MILQLRPSGQAYLQHDLAGVAAYVSQAQAYRSHLDNFHAGTVHFVQMHLHGYVGEQSAMVQEAEQGHDICRCVECEYSVSLISGRSRNPTQENNGLARPRQAQ